MVQSYSEVISVLRNSGHRFLPMNSSYSERIQEIQAIRCQSRSSFSKVPISLSMPHFANVLLPSCWISCLLQFCESILLHAAVGFVGDCVFDNAFLKQLFDVEVKFA